MEKNAPSDKSELAMHDKKMISAREIMDILPHRHPFLLVDQLVDMERDQRGVGIKNVTSSEPWFTGHFPTNPVFPGVLIIEAIAQTMAILVIHESRVRGDGIPIGVIYFMTADKVRFRHPVVPGDQMRIHVEKLTHRGQTYKFQGIVKVDDKVVAEAVIMAMNYDDTKSE